MPHAGNAGAAAGRGHGGAGQPDGLRGNGRDPASGRADPHGGHPPAGSRAAGAV